MTIIDFSPDQPQFVAAFESPANMCKPFKLEKLTKDQMGMI